MKNSVRITVALDKETNDLIEKMKEEMKVSRSELIR
ncbi:TPA: ribbon-helix-helix protein, CopG family, partial [Candidatus Bathyarchaeota archaeon]|nr:ribbon-helix-helix protein, CopG family [Candidatus Bathyarchaeota archaeon]